MKDGQVNTETTESAQDVRAHQIVVQETGLNVYINGEKVGWAVQSEKNEDLYNCTVVLPVRDKDNFMYTWMIRIDPEFTSANLHDMFVGFVRKLYFDHEALNSTLEKIAEVDLDPKSEIGSRPFDMNSVKAEPIKPIPF